MADLEALLAGRLAAAFGRIVGEPVDPAVRHSQHADFRGDGALPLGPPARGATRVSYPVG